MKATSKLPFGKTHGFTHGEPTEREPLEVHWLEGVYRNQNIPDKVWLEAFAKHDVWLDEDNIGELIDTGFTLDGTICLI